MLEQFTESLGRSENLPADSITIVVDALVDESIAIEDKANFLEALTRKGETSDEILGFARALRSKTIPLPVSPSLRDEDLLDVCGTGGDGAGSFNISTTVSILAAAAGVRVVKHGNRAITSKSGSADVLAELGVRVDLTPEDAAKTLERDGFVFLFAIHYHPAFKHIAPARKLCAERGTRTIFNFLGPLLNPARPTAQLVGVARPAWVEPIGLALQALGVRRGMVVCGGDADRRVDELTPFGQADIAEFYQSKGFATSKLDAANYVRNPSSLDDLKGGDAKSNADTIRAILAGELQGPKRDATLYNTAAALNVADRARSISEGWELAEKLIDSGRAGETLERLTRT